MLFMTSLLAVFLAVASVGVGSAVSGESNATMTSLTSISSISPIEPFVSIFTTAFNLTLGVPVNHDNVHQCNTSFVTITAYKTIFSPVRILVPETVTVWVSEPELELETTTAVDSLLNLSETTASFNGSTESPTANNTLGTSISSSIAGSVTTVRPVSSSTCDVIGNLSLLVRDRLPSPPATILTGHRYNKHISRRNVIETSSTAVVAPLTDSDISTIIAGDGPSLVTVLATSTLTTEVIASTAFNNNTTTTALSSHNTTEAPTFVSSASEVSTSSDMPTTTTPGAANASSAFDGTSSASNLTANHTTSTGATAIPFPVNTSSIVLSSTGHVYINISTFVASDLVSRTTLMSRNLSTGASARENPSNNATSIALSTSHSFKHSSHAKGSTVFSTVTAVATTMTTISTASSAGHALRPARVFSCLARVLVLLDIVQSSHVPVTTCNGTATLCHGAATTTFHSTSTVFSTTTLHSTITSVTTINTTVAVNATKARHTPTLSATSVAKGGRLALATVGHLVVVAGGFWFVF